jgi:CRP-like cAMP-binding protein
MADEFKLEGLSQSKLAAELDEAQRVILAEAMERRDLHQGEILIEEGRADDHLYVVVSGVLGIVKAAGTHDEATLNTVRPGGVVGELSFLDGATRYASLIALADSQVMSLSRDTLESMLEDNPQLVYRVMRAIVRIVHGIQRQLSMQTVELTNYLYKAHGRY